jgi:hypothetical protein
MYITKHKSTGNTCSDKLFKSDSMRLAITTHLSFYYKTDETFNRSQDICPPISQIVLKNFTKICLLIKECPEEILIKLAFVLKISKLKHW